jgi:hypothetical protein
VPENCLGKKVHCPCKRSFVIPTGWRRKTSTPASPSTPATVGHEELNAALVPLREEIDRLHALIAPLAELWPKIEILTERPILDKLSEETIVCLQHEKQTHVQRIDHLETQLAEAQARFQKAEDGLERAEGLNARRTDEYKEFVECLLPSLAFIEGSIPFMLEELHDYRHVLRVLYQLEMQACTGKQMVGLRDFKSAPGWLEIDKHIGSGQSNDVRVYVRKISQGAKKYKVLVSKKGCQDRDKKRMQDAV